MEAPQFSDILESPASRKEKAKLIVDRIRNGRHYSWVGIYDVTAEEISIISCAGRTEPAFTSFPKDKGLNGRAVISKQTVIVNDIDADEDYLLTFTDTKSEIVVPVTNEAGQIVGTIDAESEKKNAFTSEDAAFLERCAASMKLLWK